MRPTFRKLEVTDIGTLGRLVGENADGIEPGLRIVDSRLLLGQAAIDLVGLDAKDFLVLIALDFTADDGLLLRVMDAYSWCLEYPDTLRRLYPMAQASPRPPRILFIAQKMTDAFLRRVKQLNALEIDCFEFRHLEVNGAAVVYFDLIERLRKAEAPAQPLAPSAVATIPGPASTTVVPAVAPTVEPRVEPARSEPAKSEPVKQAIVWSTAVQSRQTASEPKPAEVLTAVASEPVPVGRPAAAAVPPEPIVPIAVAASAPPPAVEAKVVDVPTPQVPDVQSVKLEPTPVVPVAPVAPPTSAAPPAPVVVPEPVVTPPAPPALELQAIEATSTRAQTNGHLHEPAVTPTIERSAPVEVPRIAAPVAAAAPVVSAPAPVAAQQSPVRVAPTPVEAVAAPVPAPPVWAKPGAQPSGTRQFFSQAAKGNAPVEAPAMVAAVATAEPATQPAANKVGLEVDDRPELESLSFPKDGLSRQWLEFLSQLGATK